MSYKVLARKWRPKSFGQVVGQTHIKNILINALKNNRVGHAYLFVGTRGIGKTTLARLMAKILNCQDISSEFETCNQCPHCQSFDQGNLIDFLEIDGASNNSVEDIRMLRDNLIYPPTQGKFRIFIIDEVHMLTTQAWNALLKVLEEPPEYVKFFFATTEVNKVLPTILSRCQRLDLQPITHKDAFQQLSLIAKSEKLNISDEALNLITSFGDGSMRDSLSILEQVISFSQNEKSIELEAILGIFARVSYTDIQKFYLFIRDKNLKELFDFIHSLYQRGVDLQQLLVDMIYYGRTLLICSLNYQSKKHLDEILELSEQQLEFFITCSKEFSQLFIQTLLGSLTDYEEKLRGASNKRVCFELLLTRIIQENHSVLIENFLNSLRKLENLVGEDKEILETTKEQGSENSAEKLEEENNKLTQQIEDKKETATKISEPNNYLEEERAPFPSKADTVPNDQLEANPSEEKPPAQKSSSDKEGNDYFGQVSSITDNFFINERQKLTKKSIFVNFTNSTPSESEKQSFEKDESFQESQSSSILEQHSVIDKTKNENSPIFHVENNEGKKDLGLYINTKITNDEDYSLDERLKERFKDDEVFLSLLEIFKLGRSDIIFLD